MSFEEQLADTLKHLPTKQMPARLPNDVLTETSNRLQQSHAVRKRRRVWGAGWAGAAAICLAFVGVYSLHLLPKTAPSAGSTFDIVKSSSEMVPTPLDTKQFQTVLVNYFTQHNSPNLSSSSSTIFANQSMNTSQGPPHVVKDLAVRWSQIDASRYGYALVTYSEDGAPHIAQVLALHTTSQWKVAKVNVFPSLPQSDLKNFSIYPAEWGGGGFTSHDTVQYRLMSGLVLNRAVTYVVISEKIGTSSVRVPVVNGVWGHAWTSTTDRPLYNGAYVIRAYDKNNQLIAKIG